MVCRECGGRTCITCDVQWHPDISCTNVATKRAEERNGEEAAAGEYLTNNSKLCPQCHIRGEKVNGCDHMSCKITLGTIPQNQGVADYTHKVLNATTSIAGSVSQIIKTFDARAIICTIRTVHTILTICRVYQM